MIIKKSVWSERNANVNVFDKVQAWKIKQLHKFMDSALVLAKGFPLRMGGLANWNFTESMGENTI